jgi:hypothetical protein
MSLLVMASHTALAAEEPDISLQQDMQRVASMRIFFAHQSVGNDILDGVRQLASTSGVPIRIVESTTRSGVPPSSLGHTRIGENGKPYGKLKSFDAAIGAAQMGREVAVMKFCYVDFSAETNAKKLFADYLATISEIKRRNPDLTIVHATVPLTDIQTGLKTHLKQLLGRPAYGVVENQRREEYNSLLRQAFGGREPVFDIARVESTTPDGSTAATSWKNQNVRKLASIYTDDGSHLNVDGRQIVARDLIRVLAQIR